MYQEIDRMVQDFETGRLSRRELVQLLTTAAAALSAGALPVAAEEKSTFEAKGIDHLALTVSDIERSRRFYEQHLGLEATRCGESQCFLSCGSRLSGVVPRLAPRAPPLLVRHRRLRAGRRCRAPRGGWAGASPEGQPGLFRRSGWARSAGQRQQIGLAAVSCEVRFS